MSLFCLHLQAGRAIKRSHYRVVVVSADTRIHTEVGGLVPNLCLNYEQLIYKYLGVVC